MKDKITLDNIILFLFRGLVVILPLFFLPWTASRLGMDNFNKGYLLWIIIPLLFFLWLLKGYKVSEFRLLKSFFNIPVILLLAVFGLAVFFSIDSYSSVFGAYGAYTNPFLTFASMFLLYFFITGYFQAHDILKIVKALVFGFSLVVGSTLILFISSWVFGMESASLFNRLFILASGSFEDLAVYLAVMNILVIGILSDKGTTLAVFKHRREQQAIIVSVCLSFFFLFIINFPPAWWLVLAGISFLFLVNIFCFKNNIIKARSTVVYSMAIALLLAIISINFFVIDPNVFDQRRTAKLQLDFGNTYSVAKQALSSRPLLGYGPETFPYIFSLFRDAGVNETDYWDLRFNKPASYIYELAATAGIVGLISYFLFLIFILYLFYYLLNNFSTKYKKGGNGEAEPRGRLTAAIMAALFMLLIGQFFILLNTLLIFLFWLLLSLFVLAAVDTAGSNTGKYRLDFKTLAINKTTFPDLFKYTVLLAMLAAAGWIILFSFELKYWTAEFFYNQADASEANLSRAINLNPRRFNYQAALAKYYKEKATAELAKASGDIALAGNLANRSIDWARRAVRLAPFSVVANETLGIIYRDIGQYSKDNQLFAIRAFKEANILEPTNPVILAELGKLYLETDAVVEAIAVLEEADQLKKDYFDTDFNLAKAYSRSGRENEALAILNKIAQENANADVLFERGRIYYNIGNFDLAINDFEEVLDMEPSHSNALFSIGLAFEEIGEKDRALEFFDKVLDLNPGNEEIISKIKDLEKE